MTNYDIRQYQWPEPDFEPPLPRKFTAMIAMGFSILRSGNLVKLRRKDSKNLRLDDFIEDVVELTHIIHMETAKEMLPPLLTKFAAGESLSFGKLRISPKGLSRRKRMIEWPDVGELKFARHALFVFQRGKAIHAMSIAYQDIPNLHIFLALVRHALKSMADDERPPIRIMGNDEAKADT